MANAKGREVTALEAAALLGRDRGTVLAWLRAGAPVLQAAKRKEGQPYRLQLGELVDWLVERERVYEGGGKRRMWTLAALSLELGIDRRRLVRHLKHMTPAAHGPRGPLYRLDDALHPLIAGRGYELSDDDQVDGVATSLIEHVTGDEEGDPRLGTLAQRLALTKSAEGCERLIRDFLAERLWRWLQRCDDPEPPDWAKLDAERFKRAFRALVEGFTLPEVDAIARGELPPDAP